jgi:hypothetical protein
MVFYVRWNTMLLIKKQIKGDLLILKQQLLLNFVIIISFEELHPYACRYTNRKTVKRT